MRYTHLLILALALILAMVAALVFTPQANAQVYSVYYGAPPVTYVQPAPVAYVQPAVVYRPVLRPFTTVVRSAPATVYVAPRPVVVARPTIPVVPVAPVAPVVTTRYRPILGGTVTRAWYP